MPRRGEGHYQTTYLERGVSIGANATIVCGVRLGCYAFVGAGSVVTKNVPAFGLVYGNPARQHGWLSAHGEKLIFDAAGRASCPATNQAYQLSSDKKTVSIMSEEVSSLTINS